MGGRLAIQQIPPLKLQATRAEGLGIGCATLSDGDLHRLIVDGPSPGSGAGSRLAKAARPRADIDSSIRIAVDTGGSDSRSSSFGGLFVN